MGADFPITIYHNPKCGTSRNVLAMIEAAGYTPEVIEYARVGWSREALVSMIAEAGLTPREALRVKGADEGLPEAADAVIIDAMLANPLLVERPFVVSPKGTRLCRPSELVYALLERAPAQFTKEDGEVVVAERKDC